MAKIQMHFWAGFVDGHLDMLRVDDGFGGYGKTIRLSPALFRTRRQARAQYMDVRKVYVCEPTPPASEGKP